MANDAFALSLENAEPSDAVFEAIQDAVMETARGRWFLTEYARRNRHADTAVLLAALNRIEGLMQTRREGSAAAERANPAPIKPEGAAEGKAAAVEGGLAETAARLRVALEQVQDLAWSLRERGDPRCELLDLRIKEIAQACEMFEALQSDLDADAADAPAIFSHHAFEPSAQDTQSAPTSAFRIAASMPAEIMDTMIPAPDEFGSENENAISAMAFSDDEDPMPGILAAAQKMAQADALDGGAQAEPVRSAARAVETPPRPLQKTAEPPAPARASAPAAQPAPAQAAPAAPRMSASDRMRGLFNELHQARWGSQDGARASSPGDTKAEPPRPGDVRDAWPRVSARPAVPAKPAAPVMQAASRAPAPAAKPQGDPLAPIVGLSDEEKIALFS